jgi:hypothetical protein
MDLYPDFDEKMNRKSSENSSSFNIKKNDSRTIKNEEISDSNVRYFFRDFTRDEDNIIFEKGRILIKTFSFFDGIGHSMIVIGSIMSLSAFYKPKNQPFHEFDLVFSLKMIGIGIALLVTGIIIVKIINAYTVINYYDKIICRETMFGDKTLFRNDKIRFDDILEVSIDYQEASASPHNLSTIFSSFNGMALPSSEGLTECAVAVLLYNGKIEHITAFSCNLFLKSDYIKFSKGLAEALKKKYVPNLQEKKLSIKKSDNNYAFVFQSRIKKESAGEILSSTIKMGLGLLIGSIIGIGILILLFYFYR